MTAFGEVASNELLTRQLIFNIDQFRKGVTAPTDVTIGTTPTIPALRFAATNELVSLFVLMPINWDRTVDVQLLLTWSLAAGQINGDVLNITLDYVAPDELTTGAGAAKASTQVTGSITVTTGNGLAAGDIYQLIITLPRADATNPYTGTEIGFGLEFHLTNVTGVASADLLSGCFTFEALH